MLFNTPEESVVAMKLPLKKKKNNNTGAGEGYVNVPIWGSDPTIINDGGGDGGGGELGGGRGFRNGHERGGHWVPTNLLLLLLSHLEGVN